MQHRSHHASGVSAAAEPEDVDLVAISEVVHQETVGICDVILQPVSEDRSKQLKWRLKTGIWYTEY